MLFDSAGTLISGRTGRFSGRLSPQPGSCSAPPPELTPCRSSAPRQCKSRLSPRTDFKLTETTLGLRRRRPGLLPRCPGHRRRLRGRRGSDRPRRSRTGCHCQHCHVPDHRHCFRWAWSLPGPPCMSSLPPLPRRTSASPPPLVTSAPPLPGIWSAPPCPLSSVVPRATEQLIETCSAVEDVVPSSPVEFRSLPPPPSKLASGPPLPSDLVVPGAPEDGAGAASRSSRLLLRREDDIGTGARGDGVRSLAAADQVVSRAGRDRISSAETDDDVRSSGAVQGCVGAWRSDERCDLAVAERRSRQKHAVRLQLRRVGEPTGRGLL